MNHSMIRLLLTIWILDYYIIQIPTVSPLKTYLYILDQNIDNTVGI